MSAIDRLRRNYKVTAAGCWEWTASKNHGGYGGFRFDGRRMNAHRAAYTLLVGEVPPGLDVDHLCRNRACVNPAHLEPVTRSENLRRGQVGQYNLLTACCPKGHAYDDANTYRDARGWRGCRACRSEASRLYRTRKAMA